jgi:hypothetical protein
MGDIRQALERSRAGGEPRAVRRVRRDLEIAFRARLHEVAGEIDADDPRPLTEILADVAQASRSLAGEMQLLLGQIVADAPWDDDTRQSAAS